VAPPPGIEQLVQCVRPIAFDTQFPSAPFSVAGTGYLAGYKKDVFLVTARHVIGGLSFQRVLVYPTERTSSPLRLTAGWSFHSDGSDDDSSDIFIARTNPSALGGGTKRRSRVLNLNSKHSSAWATSRYSSMFFCAGYPKKDTYADYETQQIKYRPYLLYGNYLGTGADDGCHKLQLKNPHRLSSFDGLSGSPVFSIPHSIGLAAQPAFAGMLIRGTASSGLVHFIESELILSALEEVARDA